MKRLIFVSLISILFVSACVKDSDTEAEAPKVEILLPFPCDTIYYGEDFIFRLKLTDKNELGNLSMDIHNNFNHHSHGDNITCQMDDRKEAIHPFSKAWIHSLPNQREYTFEKVLNFPVKNQDDKVHDHGDYHFHIYVTNEDGYQVFTTLDVKILHREDVD
ncbi:DUF4625 domain-containing protein [Alkalitalea saponilacus]|uniref:DUF4625 domain-containing protein n=1 Tax=Alkalitalea saponilacus TaxID=889453 RepID=A0A1T5HKH2_9BACT|nr:DUF4625 domain-containing protein [Alkalitalea saponilacus]ASB47775.1 hypothetical protein CDL62_00715 [Alkalitalea saponilacus]SKC21162.1 protein of unknown function [Alkalitalea saponilacus]